MDGDILKTEDFNDKLGSESIWERIKKLGADKFYIVEYSKKGKNSTSEQERTDEKKYVEDSQNTKKLIETSIADNDYVKNVIKVYVDGDKSAEDRLYHEPTKSDKEMQRIQKLLGSNAKNEINKRMRDMEVKQDNTRIVKSNVLKKNK